jgi:hypothetical protein
MMSCIVVLFSNIIRVMKVRRMRWVGGACSMHGKVRCYQILVRELDVAIPLDKPRCGLKDNIPRLNLRE